MNVMYFMNDFIAFDEAYETGKGNICFYLTHQMNYFMQEHLCRWLRFTRTACHFSFQISNNNHISVLRIGLPSDFMCHSAEKADMVKDIFIYIS